MESEGAKPEYVLCSRCRYYRDILRAVGKVLKDTIDADLLTMSPEEHDEIVAIFKATLSRVEEDFTEGEI